MLFRRLGRIRVWKPLFFYVRIRFLITFGSSFYSRVRPVSQLYSTIYVIIQISTKHSTKAICLLLCKISVIFSYINKIFILIFYDYISLLPRFLLVNTNLLVLLKPYILWRVGGLILSSFFKEIFSQAELDIFRGI